MGSERDSVNLFRGGSRAQLIGHMGRVALSVSAWGHPQMRCLRVNLTVCASAGTAIITKYHRPHSSKNRHIFLRNSDADGPGARCCLAPFLLRSLSLGLRWSVIIFSLCLHIVFLWYLPSVSVSYLCQNFLFTRSLVTLD